MIKLDKETGKIEIGNFSVWPELSLLDFQKYSSTNEITKGVENAGYVTYNVKNVDNGEFILSLTFYLNTLNSLSISLGKKYQFPPWQITDAEIIELKKKLQLIGGENNYLWGTVRLFEDKKGGRIVIVLEYYRGVYYNSNNSF